MSFLKKLKAELPYYPVEKITIRKDSRTLHVKDNVRCSAVYSGQDVEAPWMPVSRRMGKARRTQRDITQPLERVSNVVCSSVDGPRDRPVE